MGLGNHGMKPMRHSIGSMVVNALASALGLSWRVEGKCRGYICETQNDQNHFVLLKPRLLMNVNGRSVVKTGEDEVTKNGVCQMEDKIKKNRLKANFLF